MNQRSMRTRPGPNHDDAEGAFYHPAHGVPSVEGLRRWKSGRPKKSSPSEVRRDRCQPTPVQPAAPAHRPAAGNPAA